MNHRIDHNQVGLMYQTGISVKVIARRLDCSVRTIYRILADLHIFAAFGLPDSHIGNTHEWMLWRYFYSMTKSYEDVAYRFGVTRQAVYDRLKIMEESKHEQVVEA